MKIEKLMQKTYNGEVSSVAESLEKASQLGDFTADAYLTGILTNLNSQRIMLSDAIMQDGVESDLEEKDTLRDNRLRGVFYLNNGYLHYPDTVVSSAAVAVEKVLDKYGLSKTMKENYALESAHLESLVNDLSADTVKANVDKLPGMQTCIDELNAAQIDFAETYVKYEEEKAIHGKLDSATTIKPVVLTTINDDLVEYLRAMRKAVPATYEEFAAATAQIINDNNTKVKKRQKKDAKV